MVVHTENDVINSLFKTGGTLANEGIEIQSHRKNAKDVYFKYNGKNFCINRNNVILKYSDTDNGRRFQYGVLEFKDSKEYEDVKTSIMNKLER